MSLFTSCPRPPPMRMPLVILAWTGCLLGEARPGQPAASFLYQPAYCMDDVCILPAQAYCPQPGDIFLSTDKSRTMRAGHSFAVSCGLTSGAPHHSGIVF